MMVKSVNKLPDEIGKKYRLIEGSSMHFIHRHFGEVNLRETMSLNRAKALADAGVGLEAIEPKKKVKDGTNK